jgi:thiamine monophosphate synthase
MTAHSFATHPTPVLDLCCATLQARLLVAACREAGALSFINDRVDVALAADADGAHVGQVPFCSADMCAHTTSLTVYSCRSQCVELGELRT